MIKTDYYNQFMKQVVPQSKRLIRRNMPVVSTEMVCKLLSADAANKLNAKDREIRALRSQLHQQRLLDDQD